MIVTALPLLLPLLLAVSEASLSASMMAAVRQRLLPLLMLCNCRLMPSPAFAFDLAQALHQRRIENGHHGQASCDVHAASPAHCMQSLFIRPLPLLLLLLLLLLRCQKQ